MEVVAAAAARRQDVREEARLRPGQRFDAGVEEAGLDAATRPGRDRPAAAATTVRDRRRARPPGLRRAAPRRAGSPTGRCRRRARRHPGAPAESGSRPPSAAAGPPAASRRRRQMWPTVRACRDDQRVAGQVAGRGPQHETIAHASTPSTSTPSRTGASAAYRSRCLTISSRSMNPSGSGPSYAPPGSWTLQFGRDEAEAVPTVSPGLSHPAALEDGVLDAESVSS